MKQIIVIVVLFFYAFLYAYNYEFIKDIAVDYDYILYNVNYYNGFFISESREELKMLAFDENGKIIKTIGGKGRGPGEYQGICGSSIYQDTLIVIDYMQFRGSLYSLKDDKLLTTFNIFPRYRYAYKIFPYKNEYLFLGYFPKNPFDPLNKQYLVNIYKKDKDRIIYVKPEINIENDLKNFINLKPRFKQMKSISSAATVPQGVIYNNSLIITYAFLPYFIKYNLNTKRVNKIPVHFTDYISPYKINIKKFRKEARKSNIKLTDNYYVFYPVYMKYIREFNEVVIYYRKPKQLCENGKTEYLEIIFDEYLNFKSQKKLLHPIICIYKNNGIIYGLQKDFENNDDKINRYNLYIINK